MAFDKIFPTDKFSDFSVNPVAKPYNKVILYTEYEDENGVQVVYISPKLADGEEYEENENDLVLEINCPWGTQEIADYILSKINGYQYCGFSLSDCAVNPAIEIGDTVLFEDYVCGLYSFELEFDQSLLQQLGASGGSDIDHEYEYKDKVLAGMERRSLTLGKDYHGVVVSRKDGLSVKHYDGDGGVLAKAVLNGDELSFYDESGDKVLYFDAIQKKYMFKGSINVADKFLVSPEGDVKILGTLEMSGSTDFIKVYYSTNKDARFPEEWSDEWNDSWVGIEVWAKYSYDHGATFNEPVLIQGKTGEKGEAGDRGPQGSSANIPDWVNAYTSSAQFNTLVTNEWVVAMNLYGSKIFAGRSDDQYAMMSSSGFNIYDGSGLQKVGIGLETGRNFNTPYILLGTGTDESVSNAGLIEKFGNGLWIGTSSAMGNENEPSTSYGNTGIWIDFDEDAVYKYENGTKSEIGSGGGGAGGSVYLVYS